MLLITLRCILRPGKIQFLQVQHLQFQEDIVIVKCQRLKTGKQVSRKSKPIPIEPSNSKLCPVKILKQYLTRLEQWYTQHCILFTIIAIVLCGKKGIFCKY